MKKNLNHTFLLFLFTVFFCMIQPVHGADYAELKSAYIASHPDQNIIPFPWEPTSSVRVLPFNYNIAAAPANSLSLTACRNEFEPASFIISSQEDLSGITITVPTLYNTQGDSIPASAITARTVKVWYQANVGDIWYATPGKYLVPELLLNDDSLVTVDYVNQTNYLKVTISGVQQYIDISSPSAAVPATARITDASTLQPFSTAANENKQIWLTVHVPSRTPAGDYHGDITIAAPSEIPVLMNFTVTVLPFDLAPAPLEYGIYYRGRIPDTAQTGINSEYKTTTQYLLELRNMRDHGVAYPTLFQEAHSVYFETALQLRNQSGLPTDHIYIANAIHASTNNNSAYLSRLAADLKNEQTVVKKYGFNTVNVYAVDETRGATLTAERPSMTAIRNAGSGIFISGYTDLVDYVGDLVSVAIIPHALNTTLAARWHGYGNKIFSYANPQAGVEDAGMYRKNYGYVLWNSGYDGEMTYAYQHSFGDIWNDYDYPNNRDHLFTYPTSNGVIDTIEWEGFREAVDDTRYLATLFNREGSDVSGRSIVTSSLSAGNDMQTIRKKVIDRIRLSVPGANFTGRPVSGIAPLKVTFTDRSTNTPTAWNWWFGDGSLENATIKNPVHTFTKSGTYTVNLTVTNGKVSTTKTSPNYITVFGIPKVTGILPARGPTAGGTRVTLTGTGFTGTTAIRFGTRVGTGLTVDSGTRITVTSPPNAAGTVYVKVTTPATTSTNASSGRFTYIKRPNVTAVSPVSGPTAGGTRVTLTGNGFTDATTVRFGTRAGTSMTVNSSTRITVTSPPGTAGIVYVTVTTPGGTSGNASASHFSYVVHPS
jgi:PKD repeat protein